jgi:hypothetical protein
MVKSLPKRMCLLLLALVLCASGAFADTFVLTAVNPSGANLGGVYTGPYVATINGVTGIQVICDDFQTNTYLNQTLTVTETKVSDLTGPSANQVVKFDKSNADKQQADYMTAAYLAIQLVGVDQSTAMGRLQGSLLNYALWYLFYDQALNNLTNDQKTTAQGYLASAQSATTGQSVGTYSHVSIWTPTPNGAAQEFISVRVPEASVAGFLGFNAFVLAVVGLFLRRRGFRFAE